MIAESAESQNTDFRCGGHASHPHLVHSTLIVYWRIGRRQLMKSWGRISQLPDPAHLSAMQDGAEVVVPVMFDEGSMEDDRRVKQNICFCTFVRICFACYL